MYTLLQYQISILKPLTIFAEQMLVVFSNRFRLTDWTDPKNVPENVKRCRNEKIPFNDKRHELGDSSHKNENPEEENLDMTTWDYFKYEPSNFFGVLQILVF